MALTSLVSANGWSQLTPSAGQSLAVSMRGHTLDTVIFLIVAPTDPGTGKPAPVAGDDALALSSSGLTSAAFNGLGEGDHVWARAERGEHLVFASSKIFPA